jgi:hypothetical protein
MSEIRKNPNENEVAPPYETVEFWVNEFGLMVNERPRFVTPEEAAAIVEKEWVEGGDPPNIIIRRQPDLVS